MKTKDRQIGWHLFLVVVVFLLLMPIVFAISNSFKTMQEAFNTVFQVIPLHPTLENGSMSILWAQKVELFSQHNICRENYFLGC